MNEQNRLNLISSLFDLVKENKELLQDKIISLTIDFLIENGSSVEELSKIEGITDYLPKTN